MAIPSLNDFSLDNKTKTSTASNMPTGPIGNMSVGAPADLSNFMMSKGQPASIPKPVQAPPAPKPAPVQAPEPKQVEQVAKPEEKPIEPPKVAAAEPETAIEKTAPSVAESTTKENPDGSKTTETKDYTTPEAQLFKKQMEDSMKSVDAEIDYAKSKFAKIYETADAAQQNLIKAIEATFDVRRFEMERINTAALNTQKLLGARSGRQRYAPELQSSVISEEERSGLIRITEIDALEFQTLATAQEAAVSQDLKILNQEMNTLADLRGEKTNIINKLYESAVIEEQRAQTRAKFEIEMEKAIVEVDQKIRTFEREESDLATSYAAINLVEVDQSSNVVLPSEREIAAMAQKMQVDVNELKAKVILRSNELEEMQSELRSNYLSQQRQSLDIETGSFQLDRARQILPFELKEAVLNLEKMALDQAVTLQEFEEATMALDSGVLPEELQKELLKSESYKDLKGNEMLNTALSNFRDKFLEFAGGDGRGLDVLTASELEELQSMKKGLAATLKQAKTLGTLDQGVENLVNGLIGEIPEPGFLRRPRVGMFTGIQVKLNSAIEQNQAEAEVNYNQLISENPAFQNSNAVERLRRVTQGLPTSYSEWAEDPKNLDQAKQLQKAIIDAGGDPSNPEDVEQAWNSIYGFNNELQTSLKGSTDVSNIKDFSRVKTSIGTGIATGIEAGSKFWAPGFDFVLEGGKGAPVRTPFSGTVVSAKKEGAWGNSVKVKLDNGETVRLSHLDALNVEPGQRVPAGRVIGTQGNTGKTYGKTGIHVDITMYKPDGSTYTSREVASMLNTSKLS